MATAFNKIFSGRLQFQGMKFLQLFRNELRPHLQHSEDGDGVCPWNTRVLSHLDAAVSQGGFYWRKHILCKT